MSMTDNVCYRISNSLNLLVSEYKIVMNVHNSQHLISELKMFNLYLISDDSVFSIKNNIEGLVS